MLLHLDDVYWTTEGRLSIEACLAAVAFLGLAILATFPLPTDTAGDRLGRIARRRADRARRAASSS